MATLVMQTLGCEVAALNTVHFSESLKVPSLRCTIHAHHSYTLLLGNHTGYKQWTGTNVSAEEILELYEGLKRNYLTDFDVMLTGYAPSAEAVGAIGSIARDLKLKASTKAGSFFWGQSYSATNRKQKLQS